MALDCVKKYIKHSKNNPLIKRIKGVVKYVENTIPEWHFLTIT
jgi:hypothetical protein